MLGKHWLTKLLPLNTIQDIIENLIWIEYLIVPPFNSQCTFSDSPDHNILNNPIRHYKIYESN